MNKQKDIADIELINSIMKKPTKKTTKKRKLKNKYI